MSTSATLRQLRAILRQNPSTYLLLFGPFAYLLQVLADVVGVDEEACPFRQGEVVAVRPLPLQVEMEVAVEGHMETVDKAAAMSERTTNRTAKDVHVLFGPFEEVLTHISFGMRARRALNDQASWRQRPPRGHTTATAEPHEGILRHGVAQFAITVLHMN